jgi:hypothetical protein
VLVFARSSHRWCSSHRYIIDASSKHHCACTGREAAQEVTEADIDAELERERASLLAAAPPSAGVAGGAGPAATNAADCGELLVLKVQCKAGSVQIRQPKRAALAPLLEKFTAYAAQHGWGADAASGKGGTKSKLSKAAVRWRLQYDGDDVHADKDTPEGLELEEGDVLDAVLVV